MVTCLDRAGMELPPRGIDRDASFSGISEQGSERLECRSEFSEYDSKHL